MYTLTALETYSSTPCDPYRSRRSRLGIVCIWDGFLPPAALELRPKYHIPFAVSSTKFLNDIKRFRALEKLFLTPKTEQIAT